LKNFAGSATEADTGIWGEAPEKRRDRAKRAARQKKLDRSSIMLYSAIKR